MNAPHIAFLLSSLCAMNSSLASPSTVYLTCDLMIRQWGPQISAEPISERIDMAIEGSGETLRITSTGKVNGASFYAVRQGFPPTEIVNRSTDAMWDVSVLTYEVEKRQSLVWENRLLLNRYTGSIRIQMRGHETFQKFGADSEGTCEPHTRKKF